MDTGLNSSLEYTGERTMDGPMGVGAHFVFGSLGLRNTVARMVAATTGTKPGQVRDSESASRLIYGPDPARTIFNTSSPDLLRKLGDPVAGMALFVDNPTEAGRKACEIFQAAGHTVWMDLQAEPEFPSGFLIFVVVPDVKGIVFVFAPKTPDPAMLAQIPQARAFVDADMAAPERAEAAAGS